MVGGDFAMRRFGLELVGETMGGGGAEHVYIGYLRSIRSLVLKVFGP